MRLVTLASQRPAMRPLSKPRPALRDSKMYTESRNVALVELYISLKFVVTGPSYRPSRSKNTEIQRYSADRLALVPAQKEPSSNEHCRERKIASELSVALPVDNKVCGSLCI